MRTQSLILTVLVLMLTQSALAEKIADITRMDGARTNVISGMGLVIGLKGTGDGGAYLPAIRPLANMLKDYADPASIADLSNANNVAIVNVIAEISENGARNGDHLDVHVMSNGAAISLANGTLYMAKMVGPNGRMFVRLDQKGNKVEIPYALANGKVEAEESPNRGVIRGGAVMEADIFPQCIKNGQFTLILDEPSASRMMSSTIAKLINESNDSGDQIAIAVDAKNILVQIPASERDKPDSFISNILRLPVPQVPSEARVRIDDKTGTIILTGDVEISPVVISHKGLTITTINPAPVASARNPLVTTKQDVALDTTNQGGVRLKDLAESFDLLKVPAEDRIAIIKELYDIGKLHAKMTIDGEEK